MKLREEVAINGDPWALQKENESGFISYAVLLETLSL